MTYIEWLTFYPAIFFLAYPSIFEGIQPLQLTLDEPWSVMSIRGASTWSTPKLIARSKSLTLLRLWTFYPLKDGTSKKTSNTNQNENQDSNSNNFTISWQVIE